MEVIEKDLKNNLKEYIVENFIYDVPSDEIDFDTSLIENKMIDSISTLQLVDYIETTYNIEFKAHEVTSENLDTIDTITHFILSKLQ